MTDKSSGQVLSEGGSHIQLPIDRDSSGGDDKKKMYDVLLVHDGAHEHDKKVRALFSNQLFCRAMGVDDFRREADSLDSSQHRCALFFLSEATFQAVQPRLPGTFEPSQWRWIDQTVLESGSFDTQQYLTWILLHGVDTGGDSIADHIKECVRDDVMERRRMPIDHTQPIDIEDPLFADGQLRGHLKPVVVVIASYEPPPRPEVCSPGYLHTCTPLPTQLASPARPRPRPLLTIHSPPGTPHAARRHGGGGATEGADS